MNPSCPDSSAAIEVRVLPINQLRPAPYNPRKVLKPTDPAYRKLERSLREFGLVEPLIWNERTGHVVGGHARLRILKALGVAEVPVSVVRLSPAREKALNIVLNNQEAQSRFDPAPLAALLGELKKFPEGELTGFDADVLPGLRLKPGELPPVPETMNQIEVTLVMPPDVYERASAELDALIGRFDITSHIRRL